MIEALTFALLATATAASVVLFVVTLLTTRID
jgi:hypothetical protein